MLDARLCFFKNGLKSSGTNQYPMNKKLMPKFLVFLSNPVVFQLMALYMTADEKAISTDLILMSPSVNIFSYLNLVIWLAHFTSMSLQRVHYYLHSWRHYSFDSKISYSFLATEQIGPSAFLSFFVSKVHIITKGSNSFLVDFCWNWIFGEQSFQNISQTFSLFFLLRCRDYLLLSVLNWWFRRLIRCHCLFFLPGQLFLDIYKSGLIYINFGKFSLKFYRFGAIKF